MLACTVFSLPNDVLTAWSRLAFDVPQQFRQTINERDVTVTILKQKTDTQFIVQADEEKLETPESMNKSQIYKVRPSPAEALQSCKSSGISLRKRSTSCRKMQCRKSLERENQTDVKRCKRLADKNSGASQRVNSSTALCEETKKLIDPDSKLAGNILPTDGIKSRLRHPGLSPLLKLNIGKFSQGKTTKSQQAVDNCYKVIRSIKDTSKGTELVKDLSGLSKLKSADNRLVCGLCEEVQKTYNDLLKHVNEHHKMTPNENDCVSMIEKEIMPELYHINPQDTKDDIKQEVRIETKVSSTTDTAVMSVVRDNYITNNFGITKPETADKEDKDGCFCKEVESKYIVINDRQERSKPRKKSSKIEGRLSNVDYRIEDSVLAELREDYTGCLLCGRIFPNSFKLSTHLYFCHKVTASAHHNVLLLNELGERQTMLMRLKESSREQMVLSGKHCPICFVGMLNSKNLIRHMAVHIGYPQYRKHLCKLKQNIKLSEQYRAVSKMHKNLAKSKELSSGKRDQEVKYEELESSSQTRIVCCICDREFVSGAQLRKHLNNLHLLSWVDYIALDTLSEDDRQERIRSIKSARKTRFDNRAERDSVDYAHQIIDCVECSKSILCQKYKAHLEMEHPEMENISEIISSMDRVLHNATVMLQANAMVQCPFCKLDLKYTQVLRHMKLMHSGRDNFLETFHQIELELKSLMSKIRNAERKERSALKIRLLCRFCGTPFADQSTRSFHENYSCAKNERRKQKYSCKFCSAHGTSEVWYENHIKQHNPVGPNYICSLCGNGYTNRSGLETHKAKDHQNLKRYSCAQCSKGFYLHSHYKTHLLKHSAERAFLCQLCNKKFKTAGSRRRHMKTIHSEHIKDGEILDKRKRNNLLPEQRHEASEQNSRQINVELDNLQTMQDITCTTETALVKTQQEGAANMSLDSHLIQADVAKIQTLSIDSSDMAALDSNLQQVGGPSSVTNLDTVMKLTTYQNFAVTQSQDVTVMDAHKVQAVSAGMELVNNQHLENVPMQYTLDSSSLLTSSINSAEDMQIILEIYFDESGNVINNMSDVFQVEQMNVDNASNIQQ